MPVLKDTRKTIKTSLKSIEGSEIVLKDGLLAGDMTFVYGDVTLNDVERALRALSRMIVDWNLTDEDGNKLPIDLDNIKKLPLQDITEIIEMTSLGNIDKKKLTNLRK